MSKGIAYNRKEVEHMTYFKNVNTLEELRKQYKELLKNFHPDNENGSVEITQEINSEYDRLFKVLKDKHGKQTTASDKETDFNKAYWNYEEDKALREILQKVVHLANITIEICGSWIWISGNTYQHKAELKEIGFRWAGQKNNGIGIVKHLEKEARNLCQWMILETIMEVPKLKQNHKDF